MNWDVAIFRLLNDLAGQSAFADFIFVFLAKYLIYCMFLAAGVLVIFWRKNWPAKLKIIFVFVLTGAISYAIIFFVIHQFMGRVRPFETLMNANQLVGVDGASFPSRHAAIAFLLAMTVFWYKPRVGAWFFIAATLVALGRVLAGVHYPADILAGAVYGTVMSFVALLFVASRNKEPITESKMQKKVRL